MQLGNQMELEMRFHLVDILTISFRFFAIYDTLRHDDRHEADGSKSPLETGGLFDFCFDRNIFNFLLSQTLATKL